MECPVANLRRNKFHGHREYVKIYIFEYISIRIILYVA